MKRILPRLCLPAVILLLSAACAGTAKNDPPRTRVTVLSVMHAMHEEMPYYGFADLREIIPALEPDVLVVELQPKDLALRPPEKNKREYPEVVYPLLDRHDWPVYALEPAEPLFTTLLTPYLATVRAFAREQPEQSAVLDTYIEAVYRVLRGYWNSPAAVNDARTDAVFAAKHVMQAAYTGEGEEWDAWNAHFLAVIEQAVREHAGKHILVIVGAEHSYWLRRELAGTEGIVLSDTPARLRALTPEHRPARQPVR